MPKESILDTIKNLSRAGIGQGLLMGWGDELEALARSGLTGSKYKDEVARIRKEIAEYQRQHPYATVGSEFVGGALPLVLSTLATGPSAGATTPVAIASAARTAKNASTLAKIAKSQFAKGAAMGATQGAVQGAGTATEGNRLSGATTGSLVGGTLGGTLPYAMMGAQATGRWIRENLLPNEALLNRNALQKLSEKVSESGLTPSELEQRFLADRAKGVSSTFANTNPSLVNLAETVAQRSGKSARIVEQALGKQRRSTKERVYSQVRKGLHPGDYFEDEARMVQNLKKQSKNMYDSAYDVGEVNDPQIIEMLQMPEYKDAFETARKMASYDAAVAKVEGGDPTKFQLRDIYKFITDNNGNITGIELTGVVPDVRTLDYMKRALDKKAMTLAESKDSVERTLGVNVSKLRNALRDRVKSIVPEYEEALKKYSDDSAVINAMRMGYKDFSKMPHEQVVSLVNGMSDAEKAAFRTGVARDIYGRIEKSARTNDTANSLLGRETLDKMKPLFDSEAHFDLYKAALEREHQLFQESNRVLGNSRTTQRLEGKQQFEGNGLIPQFLSDMVQGKGVVGSLTGAAAGIVSKANMNDEVAERVANMLMSKNPKDVAAAVKALEDYSVKAAQGQLATDVKRAATIGGATTLTAPEGVVEETFPTEAIEKRQKEVGAVESGETTLDPNFERAIQLRMQNLNQ